MCKNRASCAVLTGHTPEAAGAGLEYSPAILFFSLGKLEGTGILKFADKSEKTERSYSK